MNGFLLDNIIRERISKRIDLVLKLKAGPELSFLDASSQLMSFYHLIHKLYRLIYINII